MQTYNIPEALHQFQRSTDHQRVSRGTMCCLDMAVIERYCPLKITLLASVLDPHIYHGEGIDMKCYPIKKRK